ncbi:unnamed protein product [Allacma fusca]|uniref:Uncharacterized protein n=1 Tax=Allacma fusca TaxID=39272 RepID=A0A8J2PQH0_9HEXA|nr:unnamed protein product [Allacma fusca]
MLRTGDMLVAIPEAPETSSGGLTTATATTTTTVNGAPAMTTAGSVSSGGAARVILMPFSPPSSSAEKQLQHLQHHQGIGHLSSDLYTTKSQNVIPSSTSMHSKFSGKIQTFSFVSHP